MSQGVGGGGPTSVRPLQLGAYVPSGKHMSIPDTRGRRGLHTGPRRTSVSDGKKGVVWMQRVGAPQLHASS